MAKILFVWVLFSLGAFAADETVFVPYASARTWMWGGDHWVFETYERLCYAQMRALQEGSEAVQISCRGYRAKAHGLLRSQMGLGSATINKLEKKDCVNDGRSAIGCALNQNPMNDPK